MSGISLSRQRRPKRATGLQWTAETPTNEPVRENEAMSFLALSSNAVDLDLIATIIRGVRQLVEKRIKRLLARRTVTAQWKRVPEHADLPLPPHGSVQAVHRYTGQGDQEELTDDQWYTRGLDRLSVYPSGGAKYGLEVEYTAGYESIPQGLKMQMLRDIADRYDKRDSVLVGESVSRLPDPSAYDAWRVL